MSEFSQVAAATGGQLALRRDIAVLPAPGDEAAGAVMLFDPLRHQFFKLRGVVARLLTGDADVSATGAEREAVAAFGAQNELLVAGPQGWKKHAATAARRRRNLFSAATHGYLFFKIPLLRPQRLLTTMWPAAALFFSRTFFILTMLAAFCGLYLVQRQWDQFTATFKAFLTLEGAAIYALTLVAVKSLHELGHGFACHKRGVAVPTMGVAFMVLFPVLYTDTTGAWRLKRRDRLAIDLAGVATELTIAAWATLAWAFLPDGFARDAAFSLAAVSWVMSLAVNLNPFMRFDGYYAFSDAIGFENLNQRGFALARWRLREFLFGFGDPAPVETTPAMRRLVTAHAFATWIYRLALFIGIALLVYHFFIKLVAIVLFAIEIGYFIAMPVVREVKNWWTMRSRMRLNFATMRTVLLALSILAIAFAPLQWRVRAPAVLSFDNLLHLHAAEAGEIVVAPVANLTVFATGDILFQIEAPQLEHEIVQKQMEIALVRARLQRVTADDRDRSERVVLLGRLAALEEALNGLQLQRDDLTIRAPFGGRIVSHDPRIHVGRVVSPADRLATIIAGDSAPRIVGLVAATDFDRLAKEAQGVFIAEEPEFARLGVKLVDLSPVGSNLIVEPMFSDFHGGPVTTAGDDPMVARNNHHQAILRTIGPAEATPQRTVRGAVFLEGRSESLARRAARQVFGVLLRESGF